MSDWLDEIEARAEKATPGPWENEGAGDIGQHYSCPSPWKAVVDGTINCGPYCYGGSCTPIENEADAEFIAHSREDIPKLIAEVRRLRAQVGGLTVPLGESVARTLDQRLAETIRERDEARAAIERVEELHHQTETDALGPECSTEECIHDDNGPCPTVPTPVCAECLRIGDEAHPYAFEGGGLPLWPCSTIKALRGEGDE